MKHFLLFFTILSTYNSYSQNSITTSQAINVITKQAMLTQRMAKDKVYKINKSNNIAKANIELSSSTILFNKNMNTLDKTMFSDEINFEVFKLDLLWQGYQQTIQSNNQENLNLKLSKHADVMLDQCQSIYNKLLEIAKQNNEYPFNTNNKEYPSSVTKNYEIKHLAQKLALYYTTYYYRNKKYNKDQFNSIIEQFDENIEQCKKTSNVSSDVTEKTTKLLFNWKITKEHLKDIITNNYISANTSPTPTKIYELCNTLLNNADMLARAYKANSSMLK